MKKYAWRIYICLIFAILYIPIITLILVSSSKSVMYQRKLKPVNSAVLELSLNEKRIRVMIGI